MNTKLCETLKLTGTDLFLFGARWAFGFWLLYVGATKWLGGPAGFVGYISSSFAETWAPAILLTVLGWIIIVAEPVIGLWLMIGRAAKLAWLAAAKLMFILMFGQTMIQEYGTVANNWQYFFLCLACAALTECDSK